MGKEASGLGFWGTVFATVLAAGFLAVWSGVWGWAVGIAGRFWVHLGGTLLVPVWLLYVLGACALAIVVLAAAVAVAAVTTPQEPEWKSYTRDNFFGGEWRWRYDGNQISGLFARCPVCKTALVYREEGYAFLREEERIILSCERCRRDVVNERGRHVGLLGAVTRQIERNIDTAEWPGAKGEGEAKR